MALTDGLVAWWPLDEESGTREDAHGNHDLTDNNTVGQTSPGHVGDAANFINTNSEELTIVADEIIPGGANDFSFAAWYQLTTDASGNIMGRFEGGQRLQAFYIAALDRVRVQIEDGSSNTLFQDSSPLSPVTGEWYFIVATYDHSEGELEVWHNGSSVGSSTWAQTPATADGNTFGVGSRGGSSFWNGDIDEVPIWDRVLTSEEISELWNDGDGLAYADLAGGATLTAEHADFTLSGQDADLLASHLLTADEGTFTLSGQATDLLAGRLLTADHGTLTLSGQDAGVLAGRLLTADHGTYSLSGQVTGLIASKLLTAENGSFSLAGRAANLLAGRLLTADLGSFTLTGQDATLQHNEAGAFTLTADSGVFTLSGQDAQLVAAHIMAADSGTFTLSSQAAAVLAGRLILAEQGAFTIAGQDAALIAAKLLTAEHGEFTLAGQDAALNAFTDDVLVTLEVSLSDLMTLNLELQDVMTLTTTIED